MNLYDILNRQIPPRPWSEGEKIPWNDPDFSRRMLREHLSQDHDLASRRIATVERHVGWIHHDVLLEKPGRILDLGCGPGLYLKRLAQMGHQGKGIDFSPASIAYARSSAADLPLEYREADLRQADFGSGYDLVMFIFGELNVFKPEDARLILAKVFAALKPGGRLLLEVSSFESLHREVGEPGWYSSRQGLFSDRPHIVLNESFWEETQNVITERYFILDAETGAVSRVAASTQAYQDQEYQELVEGVGFEQVVFHPSLTGESTERGDLLPITALRPLAT